MSSLQPPVSLHFFAHTARVATPTFLQPSVSLHFFAQSSVSLHSVAHFLQPPKRGARAMHELLAAVRLLAHLRALGEGAVADLLAAVRLLALLRALVRLLALLAAVRAQSPSNA